MKMVSILIISYPTTLLQLSIMRYLKGLQICNERDELITMIPESILLEHYVSLRLALRRYAVIMLRWFRYLCITSLSMYAFHQFLILKMVSLAYQETDMMLLYSNTPQWCDRIHYTAYKSIKERDKFHKMNSQS